MNKLFIIRYYLKKGYILETKTFWNESDLLETMKLYSNWKYEISENNNVHMIVNAY